MSGSELTAGIAEVAARTGLSVATLRAWEARHGFPRPARRESGHRRYSAAEIDLIEQVVAAREGGLTLEAAIERVRAASTAPARLRTAPEAVGEAGAARRQDGPHRSVFAGVRRLHPEVAPFPASRRVMLALSRAFEDELLASGAHDHLFVAFQRAAAYRRARADRWGAISAASAVTVVFADFARSAHGDGTVLEVALGAGDPLLREWALVSAGPSVVAMLAGWERPDGRFEAVWSLDADVVDSAAGVAADLAAERARGAEVPRASPAPRAGGPEVARLAVSIASRALEVVDRRSARGA